MNNVSLTYLSVSPDSILSIKFCENVSTDLISVIKDLFGVSGRELQEIRTEIAGLQKGELIIKDQMAFALDLGKKYKKIKVSHLI